MKVEILRNLQPLVLDANRVVLRNSFGDPVFVCVEYATNTFLSAKAGDPEFDRILQNLGIQNTLVVETLHPKPLDDWRFPGR